MTILSHAVAGVLTKLDEYGAHHAKRESMVPPVIEEPPKMLRRCDVSILLCQPSNRHCRSSGTFSAALGSKLNLKKKRASEMFLTV